MQTAENDWSALETPSFSTGLHLKCNGIHIFSIDGAARRLKERGAWQTRTGAFLTYQGL
jgi:hypothetical protein